MWLACEEMRNKTMAAISSGCVIRLPKGIFETMCLSFSSGFGNVLEPDVVIASYVVDKHIQAAKFLQRLFDRSGAVFDGYKVGADQATSCTAIAQLSL